MINKFNEIIPNAQRHFIRNNNHVEFTVKCYVHTRIYNLPNCPELNRIAFPRQQDLGMFLQITGEISYFFFK